MTGYIASLHATRDSEWANDDDDPIEANDNDRNARSHKIHSQERENR